MPGKIKVKILAGRNLPVMDRSGDTTDAYVEIKFGNTTFKTDVCRKSLNPQWNSEWYRFEVDDAELQDEPLQVRLMDHDTYSANDAIGKVYINLNPLLLPGLPPAVKNIWTLEATMNSSSGSQGGSVMTGWIPVFDTMHGIRGEVNIIVKVELFSDCNKFRQSSCGVQFFYSPNIPHGYHAQVIHGFVEELVVSDDPEYKWIDKIRTPRASNEARQTLFFKLSGEVQRKIGLKALDLGGNAVIGYVQNFDLEGESGIVARGIGTAVTLVKLQDISSILPLENANIEELTCFDLQSKSQLDFSESDDSLPLLTHSPPNHSPLSRSPTNIHATCVSPRFPRYEKSRRHQHRQTVRVAEYRAAGLRARQLSLQHNATNSSMRKGIGSSMSLADDLISESSLRNMLALEDMRGEPVGNPFSRGLKNFRYLHQNILPRRVAQIKSKITDSFDDESDPESNYSSTWSLAGSESNRSPSIVDLRQSIRRKKFTHKKAANDGIAALLIRSVHSGFPLDSVREDRETPTPSPVNFLDDLAEYSDDSVRRGPIVKKDNETLSFSSAQSSVRLDETLIESRILVGKNKHDVKYTATELLIPMISSSESDTSTSEDDEPSESSTNYNILDDSCSHPSSNEDTIYQPNFGRTVSTVAKLVENETAKSSEEIENRMEMMGNRSIVLEKECSLEFSTDYNILDDSSSLIGRSLNEDKNIELSSHRITELFEAPEKIDQGKSVNESIDVENDGNKSAALESKCSLESIDLTSEDKIEGFSEKPEELIIYMETKGNRSTLDPDFSMESSTDYNILDDTNSIVEGISNDQRGVELSSQRSNEVAEIVETAKSISLDEEKSPITDNDSIAVLFIPPSQSEKIDENLENSEDVEIKELEHQSSIALRDCHSTSSTNYNFLDESYSPNENNSVDDYKRDSNVQRTIDDSKFPSIQPSSSPSTDAQELPSEKVETSIESAFEKNTFASQILESSTDYNILDDVSSSTDPNLIDDCENRETSFQRDVDFTAVSEILSTSGLPISFSAPLGQSQESSSINPEESKPQFAMDEKEGGPSLHPPPILPSLDTNLSVVYAGKTSTSGPESSPSTTPTKLKHLKFLPKQKHFDSAEDLGFVTSTPVDTDITLFADFETGQKSSSPHYMDSSKFDFQPSTSPSSLTRSDSRGTSKFESPEKTSLTEPEICAPSEKSIQQTGKQTCPLGVSFDTVRIVTEAKKPSPPKITKLPTEPSSIPAKAAPIPKKEATNPEPKSPSLRKEKTSKKVERTDTVIYKGPPKNREGGKLLRAHSTRRTSPIPIVVAPPPEEHATRLQVPVIQTTNINVQSTFSPDEMKTQHFGSIGSRKFPVDECAISDKFNRKFRQHCILDLIRTIDAKMMVHHHHERRDSTKSKRKRRDHVNASATPSPDSIHRTRTHRRRSRSRSPERVHATHPKNHVSSLSTHSFPNSGLTFPKNPTLDSASCNSSCENLSRNVNVAPIVVAALPKDSVTAICASAIDNDLRNDRVVECPAVVVIHDDENEADFKEDCGEKMITSEEIGSVNMSALDPKALEHPVYKSHSAGSLEGLPRRFPLISKTTNRANTIDDLCVPRSQLTLRQQDEQGTASSPVQTSSSALPSSLGSKIAPNAAAAVNKTNAAIPNMHRRSSDSDLSITPKGNSLAGSDKSMGGHMRPSAAIVRTMNQDTMEMLEYPFITMQQYPLGFVLTIGGLVSARSVKLLERITNLEEPEGRDAWWTEIRMEVRSHARALACNVVLGYKEEISICDDVCVLNASGTAAVINLLNASQDQDSVLLSRNLMTTSMESERDKSQAKTLVAKTDKSDEGSLSGQQTQGTKVKRTSESNDHEIPYLPTLSACSLCHLPYSEASVPFRVDVSKCAICRRAKVPDVLFTTIELPENIPMTGRGVFLQATVCKSKRDVRGELNAKEISDCLPFLEYELHSLLLNKLKVKGMNAIFGLKVQVSVGERLVIGMAVGTAVYLTALPTPSVPQIASGNSWHNEEQLAEIQKTLIETVKKNREFYRLKPITEIENGRSITTSDTDESDDELPDLDLGIGTKDACVLEVDDVEDMDRINLLMDEKPPDDFHVVNTQSIPGLEDLEIVRNLQMFTQISRAKIPSGQFASMPSKYFARMLQTVLFKLRRMVPCALCDMQFKVALPEQDEIQLSVVGMALGLGEPTRFSKYKRKLVPNSASKDPIKKTDDNDMIFSLDEDQADTTTGSQDSNTATNQSNTNISSSSPLPSLSAQKHRPRSPFRTKTHMSHRHKHVPLKERYGVDITPLSYLPGGKIERYLGNLNFFFIRESTSIRENGGLSGFTHSFVTEILAIVRAHITALGGNAMVAFFMTQCVLLHSPHKNQGQCLINVGGDVVTVSYYGDDRYQGNQNC